MATAIQTLPAAGAEFDPTVPPGVEFVNGIRQILFDDIADEIIRWAIRLSTNFSSAPVLKFPFHMKSVNTGTKSIVLRTAIWKMTPGDAASKESEGYAAEHSDTIVVDNTAGYPKEASITLSNFDGAIAGDWLVIRLARDANHASDDAIGDMVFSGEAHLEYTVA